MANGTEHWTEEHAKRQLDACEKSGLSDAVFTHAQREGIRARRLQCGEIGSASARPVSVPAGGGVCREPLS